MCEKAGAVFPSEGGTLALPQDQSHVVGKTDQAKEPVPKSIITISQASFPVLLTLSHTLLLSFL